MKCFPVWIRGLTSLLLVLLCGCAATPKSKRTLQVGESVVFIGETPAALAYLPVPGQPLRVRSAYLPDATATNYIEGQDYTVDYAHGTLQRTAGSRLPNFEQNKLFGQEAF